MGRIEAEKTQQLQLALWTVSDESKTNMVALYDLAPRFVFQLKGEVAQKKVIEREFSFAGKRYRITLKPTQIRKDPDNENSVVDRYLGEREQIVEEVIRRIASNRNRLKLLSENKVRFPFTLSEVREELRRVKHSYNLDEIREAITLLNEVRLKIEEVDSKKSPLLSAAAFPVMGMRKRDDGVDRETFVEFNPLVADAIRLLDFQQVSYELLMEIRDPVARWLLKRLHTQISATGEPVQVMLASEIRRDSGMSEWKATRNLLRRVSQAVESLHKLGILETIEAEEHMSGQKKSDITFTMQASAGFMTEIQRSVELARENLKDFESLSNGERPTKGFVAVSNSNVFKLNESRRKRAAMKKRLQAVAG